MYVYLMWISPNPIQEKQKATIVGPISSASIDLLLLLMLFVHVFCNNNIIIIIIISSSSNGCSSSHGSGGVILYYNSGQIILLDFLVVKGIKSSQTFSQEKEMEPFSHFI